MRKYIYNDFEKYESTHWWYVYRRKILALLFDKFSPKTRGRLEILDAGCGTGGTLKFLQKYGRVTGVDSNKEALAYCKRSGAGNVLMGDVENLKFKDRFDVITLLDVLEHVDEDKCLVSTNNALKKGGIIVINVPAYQWMWSGWDDANDHVKRYTKNTLLSTVERHNYKTLKVSYLYSFLVLPVFVVRKVKDVFTGKKYSSDIQLAGSSVVNIFMKFICSLEFLWFSKFNIPFGLSIVVVAQKN